CNPISFAPSLSAKIVGHAAAVFRHGGISRPVRACPVSHHAFGRVSYHNRAAGALIATGGGLAIHGGRISAPDPGGKGGCSRPLRAPAKAKPSDDQAQP